MKQLSQDHPGQRITFRGAELSQRQLTRIQVVVAEGQLKTRQALAGELCRMFGWRRPGGGLSIRSALDLLRSLERKGVVRLPAPRQTPRRRNRDLVKAAAAGLYPSGEPPAMASREEGTAGPLRVRPIQAGELLDWRAHMERFHYLGDAPMVGESLRYVAELGGRLAALLSWSSATLHNEPRDHHVGWDAATRRSNLHLVVNNARFLILPWARRPHLASQVLAFNLRRLVRDWVRAYRNPVVLAETFVDVSRFRGICYRASNWVCVGQTKGWSKSGRTYQHHGEPKSVWLYPLHRDYKRQLCETEAMRKRRERFMNLDVERLPLHGQGGLLEILAQVPEPRKARGIRHGMRGILAMSLCAVLAGARSIMAIWEWAAEQSDETRKLLGSKWHTAPSERTFRRVLGLVEAIGKMHVLDRPSKLGEFFTGFVVPGNQGQGIGVAAKIFHELRGKFDAIPFHPMDTTDI